MNRLDRLRLAACLLLGALGHAPAPADLRAGHNAELAVSDAGERTARLTWLCQVDPPWWRWGFPGFEDEDELEEELFPFWGSL